MQGEGVDATQPAPFIQGPLSQAPKHGVCPGLSSVIKITFLSAWFAAA